MFARVWWWHDDCSPSAATMSILTRESLLDGSLRRTLPLPAHLAWSEAQIAQSLADTLAAKPGADAAPGDEGAVWVFAYGSLIWNPLIAYDAQSNATLSGWRRSFCLRTISGRGRPEEPGRMLSLQPGGTTQGVALRVPAEQVAHELKLLWTREMTMGGYRPAWVPLALEGGATVPAIAFTGNPGHPSHECDDSVATVAGRIAVACGAFGRNIDYLLSLHQALCERGLRDDYVEALVEAVGSAVIPAGSSIRET
jgi:cation transport protein ChaC